MQAEPGEPALSAGDFMFITNRAARVIVVAAVLLLIPDPALVLKPS
jgi:hypothetical protein